MARRSEKVPKEYLDRLRGVSLFATCDDKELNEVAALGTEVSIPVGQPLMKQGDTSMDAYLVMRGTAICTKDDVEVTRFGPGDFFGEMALIGNRPRSATVLAGEDLSVRAFHSGEFRQLLSDVPGIAVKVLRVTAERLMAAEETATH